MSKLAGGAPKPDPDSADGRQPMRLNVAGGIFAALVLVALVIANSTLFTVYQTDQVLVVRLGNSSSRCWTALSISTRASSISKTHPKRSSLLTRSG